MTKTINAKKEVLEACRMLVEQGLVQRTWGNISSRIDEEYMVVTPSGISYESLNEDNLPVVEIANLKHDDGLTPSSECGIHADAYKNQPNTNVVVHTHQTYATCISVAGYNTLSPASVDLEQLGGSIAFSEYGTPGTKKLWDAVGSKLAAGNEVILMARHGVLVTAKDISSAFLRAKILEDVCKSATHADLGLNPEILNPNVERQLAEIRRTIQFIFPEFENFGLIELDSFRELSVSVKKIPAMIDDFAQMVGIDIKAVSPNNRDAVCSAIGGRNAVLLEGIGALCAAGNDSDLDAVMSLTRKNAMAYINAAKYGKPVPLDYIERKKLRSGYLKKYSQLIKG
jgi:L-fuculose-phosphate aldolase